MNVMQNMACMYIYYIYVDVDALVVAVHGVGVCMRCMFLHF